MLNKIQIQYLKALAHHLNPIILIGANGITENVDKEINRALESHELIKIKLGNLEDDIQTQMIEHIITTHQAQYIQKIGHLAVFYRPNPKNPKIDLKSALINGQDKKENLPKKIKKENGKPNPNAQPKRKPNYTGLKSAKSASIKREKAPAIKSKKEYKAENPNSTPKRSASKSTVKKTPNFKNKS